MKKIIILILLLLAATVFALEDLRYYPEYFETNSQFNGLIVVGDKADDADWVSAVSVSNGISDRLMKDVSKMQESYDLGEDLRYNKLLNESKDTLDFSDLGILKTSRIAAKTRVTTKQFFDVSKDAFIRFDKRDGVIGDYLFFDSNSPVYTYRLAFSPGAESEIINRRLVDIEGQRLEILGNQYIIDKARVTEDNGLKLELFSGEIRDFLFLDEEKTYVIGNRTVTIWAPIIDPDNDEVELRINKNRTKPMIVGDKFTYNESFGYKDYLEFDLVIRSVLTDEDNLRNNYVEYYIGTSYLEIEDEDIEDDAGETNMVRQDDSVVHNLWVEIDGEIDDGNAIIDDIKVQWLPKKDIWIPKGSKLSDYITDIGQLFTQKNVLHDTSFDVLFEGAATANTEEIKVMRRESRTYVINFTGPDGREYSFDIFGYRNGGLKQLTIAEEDEKAEVGQNILFTNADKKIWVMEIKSIDVDRYGKGTLKMRDVFDDEEKQYTIINHEIDVVIDGSHFMLKERSDGDYLLLEDIDDDEKTGGFVSIYTLYGGEIMLGFDRDDDEFSGITFMEKAKKKQEEIAKGSIEILFSASADKITAREPDIVDDIQMDFIEYDDVVYGRTLWGSQIEYDGEEVMIAYPQLEQAFNVTINGQISDLKGRRIVTDLKALQETKDMIIIGGPCANQMAAEVMGVTDHRTCADGFKDGEGTIKVYDYDGRSVVIIAGYSKEDTDNAAYVFSNFDKFSNFKGKSVRIRGLDKDTLVVE